MSLSNEIRLSEALRAGGRFARQNPGLLSLAMASRWSREAVGIAAAAAAAAAFASGVAVPSLAAGAAGGALGLEDGGGGVLLAVMGASIAASLIGGVLELLVLGGTARAFSRRLEPLGDAPWRLEDSARGLSRMVPLLALAIPVWLGLALFRAASLGVGIVLFVKAFQTGRGGLAASAAVAFAATAGVLLAQGLEALWRLALLRVAAAPEPHPRATAAVADATELVLARLPAVAALLVLWGVLGAIPSSMGAVGSSFVVPGTVAGKSLLALQALGVLAAALPAAVIAGALSVWELGTWAALDAGARGATEAIRIRLAPPMPRPPHAALAPGPSEPEVVETEPIHDTVPVEPPER